MIRLVLLAACSALLAAQAPGVADKPDAQMQPILDSLAALGPKPIEDCTPEEARKQPSVADAVKALLKKRGEATSPEPVGNVANRTIPGAAGEVKARVYTPKGDGPFPVAVYWHGGGFVIATIDTYDSSCRALCNAANCVVVSCDYRQAPEHPYPAAADDAFACFKWVTTHLKDLNAEGKPVALVGESAGGNLAAVTALRARDAGGVQPVYQVLVYPVTDWVGSYPSAELYADVKPLNKPMLAWFTKYYLPDESKRGEPNASPLRAKDLTKLPPATVINAEVDPLRDQGFAYAAKLRDAGVAVKAVNFPGQTHEFFGTGAVNRDAKRAVQVAGNALKAAFAGRVVSPR